MERGSIPKHSVLTAGLVTLHSTEEQTTRQRSKQTSLTTARDTAAFLQFFVWSNVPCFSRSFQSIHLVVQFQDGLVNKNTFLLLLAS